MPWGLLDCRPPFDLGEPGVQRKSPLLLLCAWLRPLVSPIKTPRSRPSPGLMAAVGGGQCRTPARQGGRGSLMIVDPHGLLSAVTQARPGS